MNDDGYLLDNARTEAGQRFAAMAELFDPWTFRHLEAAGVRPGARVWEVGAGWPSVPAWLAARVGPSGRVLATDIDTSWLRRDEGYDVLRHDAATEPAPGGAFDVVHARLVLVHLPDRARVLDTLVAALAPGGTLLVEDADPALQPLACIVEDSPEAELANRLRRGFRSLLAASGADLAFGRTLLTRLRDAGLVDVRAEVFAPYGGQALRTLEIATLGHVRERLVAADLATEEEIDHLVAYLRGGGLDLVPAPLVSAGGRRP
jgi:SAM-dependent methyltransferase